MFIEKQDYSGHVSLSDSLLEDLNKEFKKLNLKFAMEKYSMS